MDRGAWQATGVAKSQTRLSQTPMIKYICTQILPALFSFIFNWRIIAWQCCVGFCHTAAWISHRYPYVPSPWAFLPPPTPSHLFRLSLSTRLSSLHHTANSHWLFILHPWRREWQPTAVFLPGESHGQRSLGDYSPKGRKALDTTEQSAQQIYFPYGTVYVSRLLSPFVPPSPSPTVFTSLFSMSASPLLSCK